MITRVGALSSVATMLASCTSSLPIPIDNNIAVPQGLVRQVCDESLRDHGGDQSGTRHPFTYSGAKFLTSGHTVYGIACDFENMLGEWTRTVADLRYPVGHPQIERVRVYIVRLGVTDDGQQRAWVALTEPVFQ